MRHLLSISGLSHDEMIGLLDLAESLQDQSKNDLMHGRTSELLHGRTMVNMFYENSTRTRISFELAAKRLGAEVINFSVADSSASKGESLRDTAMTLQAMDVDALVVRHSSEGVPFHMTEWTDLSVINAGDGTNSHPTQALLDLYTIREQLGRLDVRVAIVGDVLHSRVARSLTEALERVGADVVLVGPPDLMSKSGRITDNLDSVLPGLDVCYMLRVQRERGAVVGDDYARDYALTRARVEMLPMHALIMHPGPVNQGVEVESGVTDSYRSVIQRQVTNGVAVRMAVLYEILGEHDAD